MQPADDIDRDQHAGTPTGAGGRLLPRGVRRWVMGALSALLLAAAYLIAVRGTAILFDLRDAVGAFCF